MALWLGTNIVDIPGAAEETEYEPNLSGFPFQTHSTLDILKESKQTGFEISLSNDLYFECPNEVALYVGLIHATLRHISTNATIDLSIVNDRKDTGSLLDQIIPIVIACPTDSSFSRAKPKPKDASLRMGELFSFYATSNSKESSSLVRQNLRRNKQQDQKQEERRTQNCPAMDPDPNTLRLTLSQVFLMRAKVVIDLAIIINDSGPLEDQIPIQRKIFERFDGWSDINDQAIVAKTNDTQTCFAIFQATLAFGDILGKRSSILRTTHTARISGWALKFYSDTPFIFSFPLFCQIK